MLSMKKGSKVRDCMLLEEQYQVTEYGFLSNVNEHKIKEIIRNFILMQKVPIFFILELPTNEIEERRLRKNDTDSFHTDVYYLDGLNANEAIDLLNQYGELLVQDGISSFGFGAHDSSAEIMASKYNVVTVYTKKLDTYKDFFEKCSIPRVEHCVTAWDTFTENCPGESLCVEIDGKTVFSLPEELKKRGLYFAERR